MGKRNFKRARGFTLFEVLVSISIFTVIATIVVFNYAKFNNDIMVSDLAYQIALSIREAQVYGISVRRGISDSPTYDSGYGIYFNNLSTDNLSYVFFIDSNKNRAYDGISDCGGECIKKFSISRGNYIDKYCVDGTSSCSTGNTLTSLTILFLRPDPDARIITNLGSANTTTITVKSPQGKTQSVVVSSTGQISIQ